MRYSVMYKVLIVASLDKRQGDGGSAVAIEVVEFDNKELADAACAAVEAQDKKYTYTQIEAFKLYPGLS